MLDKLQGSSGKSAIIYVQINTQNILHKDWMSHEPLQKEMIQQAVFSWNHADE